jgi:hypothetical protein
MSIFDKWLVFFEGAHEHLRRSSQEVLISSKVLKNQMYRNDEHLRPAPSHPTPRKKMPLGATGTAGWLWAILARITGLGLAAAEGLFCTEI